MRVGPSQPGYRARLQTTLSCSGKDPGWCASKEKGSTRSGQVRAGKTNVSEPLMKCRKRRDDVKTGGWSLTRDKFWMNLFTARAASGIKVA